MKTPFFQQQTPLLLTAILLGSLVNGAAQGRGGGGGGGFNPFQQLLQGGGFGGGGGGGGRGGGGGPVTPRVVAVADERTNSLIVSAPDEIMELIEKVIMAVNVDVDDITVLRVFKLQNANPADVVNQLATLYPDQTQSGFGNRGFGGNRGGRGGGFNAGNAASTSQRITRLGRVMAVADPRTSSVIVSASKETMTDIEGMIEQLDKDPAKRNDVYVFQLENADPIQVEETLRMMFEGQNTANRNTTLRNRNTTGTALSQRSQGNARGQGATRTTTQPGNRGAGAGLGQ